MNKLMTNVNPPKSRFSHLVRLSGALIASAMLLPVSASAQDYSKVNITAAKVAGAVHMLQGAGGNIGVSSGEDGVLIIDDQFAPLSKKIMTSLKKLGSETPKFIINTHWHFDHTGGNEAFGKTGLIIAHLNVRERLSKGQTIEFFNKQVPAAPEAALPVITFKHSMSIHFNGEEVEIIHVAPSHTDGDSVVWFKGSNVIHLGDNFFNGGFPFVDYSSGGSLNGLLRNIETFVDRLPPNIKIIPGHGALASLDDLKNYRNMLRGTIEHVAKALAAGKSLDEIKKAGLDNKWESFGHGFIKEGPWIDLVAAGLKKG